MAQAVTMFDGWFAGQRLSTTQRYLQVTANAIVKLNFQHSVSQPHFFCLYCFCCSIPLLFFSMCSFTATQHVRKERKNKQTDEECPWLSF